MEVKCDCFAYRAENNEAQIQEEHCEALVELICKKKDCKFYKKKRGL